MAIFHECSSGKKYCACRREAASEDVVLFQERWRRRPFWMLVGCILVNRTTWEKARPIHRDLTETFGTPASLSSAIETLLVERIKGLGFGRVRAKNLIAMARAYRFKKAVVGRRALTASEVSELPGCGEYAADSWAIFVEGRRPAGVTDKKLKAYMKRNPIHVTGRGIPKGTRIACS